MTERTKEALADALATQLEETRGQLIVKCDSEDESVLLAFELQRRGWRARAKREVLGKNAGGRLSELKVVHAVNVSGRSTRKAGAR